MSFVFLKFYRKIIFIYIFYGKSTSQGVCDPKKNWVAIRPNDRNPKFLRIMIAICFDHDLYRNRSRTFRNNFSGKILKKPKYSRIKKIIFNFLQKNQIY